MEVFASSARHSYESTSQLFAVLKSFIVWFSSDNANDAQFQQSVQAIKGALTQLLTAVGQG